MTRMELIAELGSLVNQLARGELSVEAVRQRLGAAAGLIGPPPLADQAAAAPARRPDHGAVIQRLFDYWVVTCGKDRMRTKLTPERRAKLKARLDGGASEETIRQAILGCSMSDYHMGQNDSGTLYNDITLICRNDTKLEQFVDRCSGSATAEPSAAERALEELTDDDYS